MKKIEEVKKPTTMERVKSILVRSSCVMIGFTFAFLVMFIYSIVIRFDALSIAYKNPQQVLEADFVTEYTVVKK